MENSVAKIPVCYHCGKKTAALFHCEVWAIRACRDCIKSNHQSDHETCTKQHGLQTMAGTKPFFLLRVTSFTGRRLQFVCRLGQELTIEDHPFSGCYLYFASGMVLVQETRHEINHAILRGLRAARARIGIER